MRSRRRRQPAKRGCEHRVVSSLWLSRPAYVSLTAAEAKAPQPLSLSQPETATTAVGNRPTDHGRRRRRLDAASWPLLLLICLRDTVPCSRRNVRPKSAPASVRVSGIFFYLHFFTTFLLARHKLYLFFICACGFYLGLGCVCFFLRRETTMQRGPINKNFIGSRMGSGNAKAIRGDEIAHAAHTRVLSHSRRRG